MKIKTLPSFFGKEVILSEGKKIKFSSTGELEVDNKFGKQLLELYSTFMFDADAVIEKEKTTQEKHVDGIVERLQNEVYDLKEQVKQIKSQKEGIEADLKVWQEQYLEAEEKIKIAEKALDEEKISIKKTVETFELKISLMNSSNEILKKLCSDSNYPKEEWEKLSKEKLIEYLLNNN